MPPAVCADEKIVERWPGVGAAAFPSANDIVALGDEIGRTPEFKVGECGAEIEHEIPHVLATPPRCMQ